MLGCFRLFSFVLGRLICFGCAGDSVLFSCRLKRIQIVFFRFFMFSVAFNLILVVGEMFLTSEGCAWLLRKPFRLLTSSRFFKFNCLKIFGVVQVASVAFLFLGSFYRWVPSL